MATSSFAKHRERRTKELAALLIGRLIGVSPRSPDPVDRANYGTALDFVISNLYDHTFLDPHPKDIRQNYVRLSELMRTQSQFTKGDHLDTHVDAWCGTERPGEEWRHGVLSLLWELSNDPVGAPWEPARAEPEPEPEPEPAVEPGPQEAAYGMDSWDDDWDEASTSVAGSEEGGEEEEEEALEEQDDAWAPRRGPEPVLEPQFWKRRPPVAADGDAYRARENAVAEMVQEAQRSGASKPVEWMLGARRPTVVSEYEVVREALMMLQHAEEGSLFRLDPADCSYAFDSNVAVAHLSPGSLRHALAELCSAATTMLRLRREASALMDRGARPCGVVVQALGAAVGQYLRDVYTPWAQRLETQCRQGAQGGGAAALTVLGLLAAMRPRSPEIDLLRRVLGQSGLDSDHDDESAVVARVLTTAYQELEHQSLLGRPSLLSFALSLFASVLRPYLQLIDEWLSDGALVDPRGELPATTGSGVLPGDDDEDEDDESTIDYWDHAFVLRRPDVRPGAPGSALPLFFPRTCVKQMMAVAKSITLLRRIEGPSSFLVETPTLCRAFFDTIASCFGPAEVAGAASKEEEEEEEAVSLGDSADVVGTNEEEEAVSLNAGAGSDCADASDSDSGVIVISSAIRRRAEAFRQRRQEQQQQQQQQQRQEDEDETYLPPAALWKRDLGPSLMAGAPLVAGDADAVGADDDADDDAAVSELALCADLPAPCRVAMLHARVPTREMIRRCLIRPIYQRYRAVSPRLVTVLLRRCHLHVHLLALRNHVLFGSGGAMQAFLTSAFFDRLDVGDVESLRQLVMGDALREAISDASVDDPQEGALPDLLPSFDHPALRAQAAQLALDRLTVTVLDAAGRPLGVDIDPFVLGDDDRRDVPRPVAEESTDCLRMDYRADWPLDLVIDRVAMREYNAVFSFIVALRWAKHVLEATTAFRRDVRDDCIHRFHLLRARLLHFVNAVHNHTMTNVIQDEWQQLWAALHTQDDATQIVVLHRRFLRHIRDRCLLGESAKTLHEALRRVLRSCRVFANLYKAYVAAPHGDRRHIVDEMRKIDAQFDKDNKFLLTVLSVFTQTQASRIFAGLADLHMALNYNGAYE